MQGDLNEEVLHGFDAVVVTDKNVSKETLVKWNDICRSRTKTVTTERGEVTVLPNPTSFLYCFTGKGTWSRTRTRTHTHTHTPLLHSFTSKHMLGCRRCVWVCVC